MKTFICYTFFLCIFFAASAAELVLDKNNEKTEEIFQLIWDDEQRDEKQLEELIKQGANPQARQKEFGAIEEGWDVVSATILQAKFHLLKPLLENKADVHNCLFPPIGFMAALVHGHEGCCSARTKKNALHEDFCFFTRAYKNYDDQSQFKSAYINSLLVLLDHKADVDSCMSGHEKTALVMAQERGHYDIVELLKKYGAKA